MQKENIDKTVVMFFITKRPYKHINPQVYKSQVLLDKLDKTCEMIQEIIGDKLFFESIKNKNAKIPDLNDFIPEYWKLRFRRTVQSWQTNELPIVVTHDLEDPDNDEILNFLDASRLVNNAHDKVKIIYHPDFITATSPINKLEYDQFVMGCHLGVFPSYYEPWGYTPLESMARGIPAVTSDLSGFGDYVLKTIPDSSDSGVYVINRSSKTFDESAEELSNTLLEFTKLSRGERVRQRYRVETIAEDFDWKYLSDFYNRAYALALLD
jgi:glycogen(starch) synthase